MYAAMDMLDVSDLPGATNFTLLPNGSDPERLVQAAVRVTSDLLLQRNVRHRILRRNTVLYTSKPGIASAVTASAVAAECPRCLPVDKSIEDWTKVRLSHPMSIHSLKYFKNVIII
jgi:hypothetical protein